MTGFSPRTDKSTDDEQAEVNIATCGECGSDTVATHEWAEVSICPDCIQQTAKEAGF